MEFKLNDAFILSLLILIVESNEHHDTRNSKAFTCPAPESTTCSCSPVYGDYELSCPYANPSIILRINPKLRVQIDCATQHDNDFSLLPKMDIGDIPTVQIARCPLPKGQSIVSILDHLGIKKIRGFFFSSYGANLVVSLIRQHLSGLNDLERLYLSGNGLTELPDDLFNDVSNIKWLDLQRNKVHLPRDIFKNLHKLEYLELGYNNLEAFEPGVFKNQNKLILLNLWGNNLKNLTKDAFEGLTSLKDLDLSASNIEILQTDVLYHVKNLSNLNLSGNKITSLPAELFSHCTNLERLRLINNRVQLKSLPNDLFKNNTKLSDLSISGGMTKISSGIFKGAINLLNLSLARNELEILPKGLFEDQVNLHQLDLSKNKLVELNDVFESTPNLVTLILSENQLTNISGTIFQNLKKLRQLLINNNNLHRIHQNAFIDTNALEFVYLENNFLSFMETDVMIDDGFDMGSPFQHLNELKILDLRNNSISIIFHDWTVTALQMQNLDLSYNNISSITLNDLQFLSSNTIVNLTNNNISEIDLRGVETFGFANDDLPANDVKIYIENNPIHCDCMLLHLVKYLQNDLHSSVYKILKIIAGDLSCMSPENLQGHAVSTLNLDELLCPLDSASSSIKRCPKNCDCMVRVSDKSLIINCSNVNLTKVPELPQISSYQLDSIELHIENNSISELPLADTPGYSDVRRLFARNNRITCIDATNLPNNLTILDISNNRLVQFNETAITQLNTTKALKALSLAGNEWNCDCDSLSFLLLAQNKFKIITDYQNLKCENGEFIAEMGPSDFCPEDNTAVIASSVTLGIIGLLIGILLALYYKYNQEIKVWLFANNLCLWFVTEEELDKDKKYDAFISYSHKDEEFITDHLVPNLESGSNPFKLCLHIRDWIVGEWIPSQIAKSVEDSRRTIVVLSPNFLESVWGRMEFRTAHKNALNEGRARVIVIIYGEIGNISGLEPELKAYLNMNTYVKWGDPWFWDKLRYAMPHPQNVKLHSKRGLIKNGLKGSVDDKLELIMPSPTTPTPTTPPAEIIGNNHIAAKLNGSINNHDKTNGQGINGYANGAFIINTASKQSDV